MFGLQRRYAKSEDGNVAAITAVGLLAIVGLSGAALDYSFLSSAKNESQQIADAVALRAAVFVKEHNRSPKPGEEDGLAPGTYTVYELGRSFGYGAVDGAKGVTVDLVYDHVNGEARTVVKGKVKPTIMQMAGRDRLNFSSVSTVAFDDYHIKDAASIALVLDNTGSMGWDTEKAVKVGGKWTSPPNANKRMDVLKDSSKAFMGELRRLVGDQTQDRFKLVRTGMVGFDNLTTQHVQSMQWRLLTDAHIDAMSPGGGTYPDRAMVMANSWMTSEDAVHKAMNDKDPLKYVIFITDGENDQEGATWENRSGTGEWRRLHERWEYQRWSSWQNWSYKRYRKWYDTKRQSRKPSGNAGQYVDYRTKNNGLQLRFNHRVGNWSEGRMTRPTDDKTLAACNAMKAQGVTVYTVGFGLEAGRYMMTGDNSRTIDQRTTDFAYDLLQDCATSDEHFIIAADAVALEEAFATIGYDIAEEIIRIKS